MDKTIWKSTEKKFAPRNKQAAMIIRPNKNEWHAPPAEVKEPVFAKHPDQIFHEEQMARRARVAELDALYPAKQPQKKRKVSEKTCKNFKTKQAKKLARLVEKNKRP